MSFSLWRSFTLLVKFIPFYFCKVIVNGIFFSDLSRSSFLVYIKTSDFCMLLMYFITLLKVFIKIMSFQVKCIGFAL